MKKSKHFRKDVIMARIIAAVLLLVLIVVLVFAISHFTKPSEQNKDSQNTESTQNTNQDTEDVDFEDTQEQTTEESTEPDVVPEPEPSVDEKTYVKTTATLRLRVEPNTSCETLAQIPSGTQIEVVEDLDRWYKVIYNGQEGYVSKTYVVVVETE